MPEAAAPAPTPPPARRRFAIYALAGVVLAGALSAVAWTWSTARERGMRQAEADFRVHSDQVVDLLRQRLLAYELLVRGGVSLHESLPRPTQQQWQRYVSGLDIDTRFPALQALGFAADVRPDDTDTRATTGLPTFADDGAQARALVLYASPESAANAALAGVDLSADLRRREALDAAAASGALRMSLPVPALGTPARTAAPDSLALFAPVYAPGGGPAQRESLQGWVFAQLRIDRLAARALASAPRREAFSIVDVSGGGAVPIYRAVAPGAVRAGSERDAPAFTRRIALDVPGRRWMVELASPSAAQVQRTIPGLRTMLAAGVLGSLLLFAIVLAMARMQARVEARAARMSDSWRRSDQRFRRAMHYSAIGKALLDRGGRILDANPALAQLLGTTREALVGSLFGEYFADDESVRTMERNVLAGSAFRTTRRLRRSDGDVRHASLVFVTVPGESGEEFASLVQVEDVTERMRAEAQVQSLNRTLEARVALRTRELSHANRELEAFAYGVSHDLRAPLRAIDGFGRLLGERYHDAIDEHGRDYLLRIRSATARMSDLIEALLRMAHVSRGELRRQPVDLSRLAHDIAADLQATEPARAAEFSIAPGLRANGDPALVRTLLENLLDNAWKFTRSCDVARIELGGEGEAFFVRDNGVGFPQAQAGKLFQPFQRLHAHEAFAGHGIGLASVKRIVERHGGSVRAEGSDGGGATFWFTLPAGETGSGSGTEQG